MEIMNTGPTAPGDNILAVTGAAKSNYEFELEFSDKDIGGGTPSTLGLAPVTVAAKALAETQQGLAAGGITTITINGTAIVVIPNGQCNAVIFLCARLLTVVPGASYVDTNTTDSSNVYCMNITAQKSCAPGRRLTILLP